MTLCTRTKPGIQAVAQVAPVTPEYLPPPQSTQVVALVAPVANGSQEAEIEALRQCVWDLQARHGVQIQEVRLECGAQSDREGAVEGRALVSRLAHEVSHLEQLMEALEKTKRLIDASRSVLVSKEAEIEGVKQQLAELKEAHATEVDEVRNLRVLSLQGSKDAEMHTRKQQIETRKAHLVDHESHFFCEEMRRLCVMQGSKDHQIQVLQEQLAMVQCRMQKEHDAQIAEVTGRISLVKARLRTPQAASRPVCRLSPQAAYRPP